MDSETTFYVAFWVLLAILLIIRVVAAVTVRRAGERLMPDQDAIHREGKGAFFARVVAFVLLLVVLAAYEIKPSWMVGLVLPLPGWLRWVGFGVGLVGLALLAWTQATLGRYWSAQLQLREEHALVTGGPYAWVRHPLYSAGMVFMLGLALVSAHLIFIALAVISIIGIIYRTPKEERMLIEEFGEAYRAYMRGTGRFLPRA